MKKVIKLKESDIHRIVHESVKKVLKESDFHRAFKSAKRLNGVGDSDGSYRDKDVFRYLNELKTKLRQAEERAMTGNYDEGEARNYLVGAIKGLEAFINDRYGE